MASQEQLKAAYDSNPANPGCKLCAKCGWHYKRDHKACKNSKQTDQAASSSSKPPRKRSRKGNEPAEGQSS